MQETDAARMETAELRAACSRLEAEVAYLHEALAGVCGSLRIPLPARPPALVRTPCQCCCVWLAVGRGQGNRDARFVDRLMFVQGGCFWRERIVGSVFFPARIDGSRSPDLPVARRAHCRRQGPSALAAPRRGSSSWAATTAPTGWTRRTCFRPGAGGGSWATLAPQGYPRSFSAAAMLGSGLYVVGGGNGEDWFDSVLRCACSHPSSTWDNSISMKAWGPVLVALQLLGASSGLLS